MKPQTQFLIIISLWILFLGGAYYIFSRQTQESLPVFAATIRRDCAPWDGSAFTVSIPIDEGVIGVSIYQAPDISLPEKFSFPDRTGETGSAFLLLSVDVQQELGGDVLFQSVAEESSVEAEFDLRTKTGRQFKGKFVAEWENQPVLCG